MYLYESIGVAVLELTGYPQQARDQTTQLALVQRPIPKS